MLCLVKAEAGVKVGLFLRYDCMGCPAWVHAAYDIHCQQAAKPGVYTLRKRDQDTFLRHHHSVGWDDLFKLGPITTTAPLAPFLVDGQLQLQVVMRSVDGVTCGDVDDGTCS